MKFVRFGPLTLRKQVQYEEPGPDMWPSSPPRKKGFFAFPVGYMDPFYLPLDRPPEHPHSLLQYLRSDDGKKMTRGDLYERIPDDYDDYYTTVFSQRGREFLKKRHLSEKHLFWIKRPSYVMVYPDATRDLTFYRLDEDDEDRSRLNQPLEFLLGPDGEKIDADRLFYYCFSKEKFPENYEGYYEPPLPDEDYDPEYNLHYPDGRSVTVAKWLEINRVSPDRLCIWPVYPKLEDEYVGTLKKYRVFEYEGSLWHHLGMLLKRSEILAQFSDTWYYTDIRAYERALAKANRRVFGKKRKYQRQMNYIGYFGAREWNGTFDQTQMFEVFFDSRIS